jgi:hypothetical protein
MTESLVASPEVSASRNGPGVGVGLTIGGFRSLARGQGRALENQALAFIASTPARDAGLVRRHPGVFELRFVLTRPPQVTEGEALARELCARMIRLAEAAGLTGVFGLEFFPLGLIDPPSKTATILQAGASRTPLQWRRAFDPEPY